MRRSRRRGDDAQAVLETALVIPILLFLICNFIAVMVQVTVQQQLNSATALAAQSRFQAPENAVDAAGMHCCGASGATLGTAGLPTGCRYAAESFYGTMTTYIGLLHWQTATLCTSGGDSGNATTRPVPPIAYPGSPANAEVSCDIGSRKAGGVVVPGYVDRTLNPPSGLDVVTCSASASLEFREHAAGLGGVLDADPARAFRGAPAAFPAVMSPRAPHADGREIVRAHAQLDRSLVRANRLSRSLGHYQIRCGPDDLPACSTSQHPRSRRRIVVLPWSLANSQRPGRSPLQRGQTLIVFALGFALFLFSLVCLVADSAYLYVWSGRVQDAAQLSAQSGADSIDPRYLYADAGSCTGGTCAVQIVDISAEGRKGSLYAFQRSCIEAGDQSGQIPRDPATPAVLKTADDPQMPEGTLCASDGCHVYAEVTRVVQLPIPLPGFPETITVRGTAYAAPVVGTDVATSTCTGIAWVPAPPPR